MKENLKTKLDIIMQTLKDQYKDDVPISAIDRVIMDTIGVSQATSLQYKKALLLFNYMSVRVPKKLWRITNDGTTISNE